MQFEGVFFVRELQENTNNIEVERYLLCCKDNVSMYRTGASKAGLMASLAVDSGTTVLNSAVTRGDVEIVKILLENGADPYIENDLGMNAFDTCEKAGPFPSVQRVLEEHVNEEQPF